MALLNILHFPDPRLRTRAEAVTTFDAALKTLADDMLETMYDAGRIVHGLEHVIGLAATQVDRHIRMLVMDVSEEHDSPRVLVNPQILSADGEEEMDEGCLSVPGFYETVRRADKIRVRAQDVRGDFFELDADGLEAVCIQHEMDHLEGKLFVDYLSNLKRDRIRKKLEKQQKQADRG